MPNRALLTDADWLRQRYEADHATLVEIAEETGVSMATVSRSLRRHGIDTLPAGTKRAQRGGAFPGSRFERLRDREWLAAALDEGRTLTSIAKEVGANTVTVRSALIRLGLKPPARSARSTYTHNPGVGTCQRCSTEYERTSPAQRWCSPACREAAKAVGVEKRNYSWNIPERTCEDCGETFQPEGSRQRYCSANCRTAARRAEPRDCKVCGQTFTPPNGDGEAAFCSTGCRYTSRQVSDGRSVNAEGYVKIRHEGRQVSEHRLVMERALGRPLLPEENVHHISGDRLDNRPENLELWTTKQPKGQRVTDKVDYAVEVLMRYRPDLLR